MTESTDGPCKHNESDEITANDDSKISATFPDERKGSKLSRRLR